MGADVAFETEGVMVCTNQKIWNGTKGVLENVAEGELRLEMFVCSQLNRYMSFKKNFIGFLYN